MLLVIRVRVVLGVVLGVVVVMLGALIVMVLGLRVLVVVERRRWSIGRWMSFK